MNKVGSIIVTYNPDILILKKNIDSVISQINRVIIVDNDSKNYDFIQELINENKNIHLISNSRNYGIATALNQGMKHLKLLGYNWAITLDQDSILEKDAIKNMVHYCRDEIGIICPKIEYNRQYIQKVNSQKVEEIKACMTSASLTNIEAWEKVGGFDEEFFIDYVDNDFCMKLRLKEYSILRVNDCILKHNLGEGRNFKIFNKKIYYFKHSPIRCYYIIRNIIIFNRRYRFHINYLKETLKVVYLFFYCLCFCEPRIKTFKYLINGVIDGIFKKTGAYNKK